MPNLRAFAERGMRFSQAISVATWTRPALLGLYGGALVDAALQPVPVASTPTARASVSRSGRGHALSRPTSEPPWRATKIAAGARTPSGTSSTSSKRRTGSAARRRCVG